MPPPSDSIISLWNRQWKTETDGTKGSAPIDTHYCGRYLSLATKMLARRTVWSVVKLWIDIVDTQRWLALSIIWGSSKKQLIFDIPDVEK
jgi:hypothetical protein